MTKGNKSPSVAELNAAYDNRAPATMPLSQKTIYKQTQEAKIAGEKAVIYYGVHGAQSHPHAANSILAMKGVHVLGNEDDMFLGNNNDLDF